MQETSGDLVDQCSGHDIPPAICLLTDGQGHVLELDLDLQAWVTECSPDGGSDTRSCRSPIRCSPIRVLVPIFAAPGCEVVAQASENETWERELPPQTRDRARCMIEGQLVAGRVCPQGRSLAPTKRSPFGARSSQRQPTAFAAVEDQGESEESSHDRRLA